MIVLKRYPVILLNIAKQLNILAFYCAVLAVIFVTTRTPLAGGNAVFFTEGTGEGRRTGKSTFKADSGDRLPGTLDKFYGGFLQSDSLDETVQRFTD